MTEARDNQITSMTRYYRNSSQVHLTQDRADPRSGTYRILRGTPRACLVTLTDGVTVWFGISRAHKDDTFNKRLARKMAAGRAQAAFKQFNSREPEKALPFTFDAVRLFGVCEFGDLKQLLDVFYTLDKSIYRYLPQSSRRPVVALPLEEAVIAATQRISANV